MFLNIFAISSFAQMDREFWFAVPEVTSQHADRPIKVYITSGNRDAYVNISIPANQNIEPIDIDLVADSSVSIDLTDWIDVLENTNYNSPQNKGLLISSTDLVTVYYETLGSQDGNVYNTDIFTLKGGNALGTEFYTPFQTKYNNVFNNYVDNAWSSIDIVATEDNTEIEINLTNEAFNTNQTNYNITLNRGQTYSIRNASRLAGSRFSGSKITSNKPIAVTLKDDSVKREDDSSYDLVGDQIVPVNLIGVEYILLQGESFVLATEDNTDIYISGVYQTTIDEGETYVRDNIFNIYLETSKPVYVLQLTETAGEYGGALLPHISCTGSYNVSFNRANTESLNVILLVKNGGQDNFLLNDQSGEITAADFSVVTGTNSEWYGARKQLFLSQVAEGEISKIENTTTPFHLGLINGGGSTGSKYGYFSNFNILDLGVDFDACDNTILEVENGLDSYTWSTGESTRTIQIDSSGMYWVKGIEGTCETIDTINVEVKPGVDYSLPDAKIICDQSLTFEAPDSSNFEILWSDGSTEPTFTVVDSGTYSLKITNQYDCVFYDEFFVDEIEEENKILNIEDTVICNESVFINLNDNRSSFIWFDENDDTLTTESFYYISEKGTYTVMRENICNLQEEEFFVDQREINIPNIYTPNGDLINDEISIELGLGVWDFRLTNRWGKSVFSTNNFDGHIDQNNLSDGIYFYSLYDQACEENYKGWIQINR